jgi:hypothetical protein
MEGAVMKKLSNIVSYVVVAIVFASVGGWALAQSVQPVSNATSSATSNMVTTDTTQSITGAKTFTGNTTALTFTSSQTDGGPGVVIPANQCIYCNAAGTCRICFDGTNLNLLPAGSSIVVTGGSIATQSITSGGNPSFNTTGTNKMRLTHNASSAILLSDDQGAAIGNGSGDEADGVIAAGMYITTPTTVTIADDGAGTSPTTSVVVTASGAQFIACNDADNCTASISESGATSGTTLQLVVTTTGTVTVSDSAGVSELEGAAALGQYDSLTLLYVSDRWVEVARSNN